MPVSVRIDVLERDSDRVIECERSDEGDSDRARETVVEISHDGVMVEAECAKFDELNVAVGVILESEVGDRECDSRRVDVFVRMGEAVTGIVKVWLLLAD